MLNIAQTVHHQQFGDAAGNTTSLHPSHEKVVLEAVAFE
jgi:hypothetical protein